MKVQPVSAAYGQRSCPNQSRYGRLDTCRFQPLTAGTRGTRLRVSERRAGPPSRRAFLECRDPTPRTVNQVVLHAPHATHLRRGSPLRRAEYS
eukprot:3137039-Prymnesium_polylepis.1